MKYKLVFEQYRYFEHFELNIDHRLRCRFKNYRSYLVVTPSHIHPSLIFACEVEDHYRTPL